MPRDLQIFHADQFIDPQTRPYEELLQLERLFKAAQERVGRYADLEQEVDDVRERLEQRDWIADPDDVHRLYRLCFDARENEQSAFEVEKHAFLLNYFQGWHRKLPVNIEYYEELITMAAPPPTQILWPPEFLAALMREPATVLLTEYAASKYSALWHTMSINSRWKGPNSFLPLPITGRPQHGPDRIDPMFIYPQAVTAWPFVTARFEKQDARELLTEVRQVNVPIVSITTNADLRTEVIFRVDAPNKRAWNEAAADIKTTLLARDLYVTGGFCYNSIAKIPDRYAQLLQFNP